jgi:cystathionine gamma-lyase
VPRGARGRKHGIAFGSGCAATTAVLLTLKSGDHVLVGDDVYGGTFRIFDKVLKQFGVEATFLDMSDPAASRSDAPNTRLVWMETPSNPMLKIFDIAAIAEIARARGVPLASTTRSRRPCSSGRSSSARRSSCTRRRST